jgi:RodZ C-terminal domain
VPDVIQAPAFDEAAALAELERLQQELRDARCRREELTARFDAFVHSVHVGDKGPPPALAPFTWRVTSRARSTARSTTRFWIVGTAGVVLLVAAAAALMMRVTNDVPPAATVAQQTPTPGTVSVTLPTAAPAMASRAAARAPAVAPRPGRLNVELKPVRAVWVRAFVDGRKLFERQLAAGERVPLTATRVIIVRAGDAGALRLSIDSRDAGPLGRDGIVVTRLFTAPPLDGR